MVVCTSSVSSPKGCPSGKRQGGFTLIELMFVVVVIGILAVVAVVAFGKNTRKARATEVTQMFGEFQLREEAFHSLNGSYISTGDEGVYFPDPLSGDKTGIVGALPARWTVLRIDPGTDALYCQYGAIAGVANDRSGMGPIGDEYFPADPTRDWFYLVGRCDFDRDPSVNAEYSQRGGGGPLDIRNEGR